MALGGAQHQGGCNDGLVRHGITRCSVVLSGGVEGSEGRESVRRKRSRRVHALCSMLVCVCLSKWAGGASLAVVAKHSVDLSLVGWDDTRSPPPQAGSLAMVAWARSCCVGLLWRGPALLRTWLSRGVTLVVQVSQASKQGSMRVEEARWASTAQVPLACVHRDLLSSPRLHSATMHCT